MRLTLLTSCAAAFLIAVSTPTFAAAQVADLTPAVTAVAVVANSAQTQQPQDVKVDINLGSERGTVWYYNPVWIALGVLAVVVLGLIIGMVARGGGSEGTTIVK